MILDEIKSWSGKVAVNGVEYPNIEAAREAVCSASVRIDNIRLYAEQPNSAERKIERFSESLEISQQYVITVKSYMTKPASPEFDFMAKWNNDTPMPLRTMVGTVEKETRGMVYMKLHGDITSKLTQTCMKCGRPITNPVSQFFGMGPECGGHNYVNPFRSEAELKEAVENYRNNFLRNIKWEGWIIKSAIVEKKFIGGTEN